MNKKELAELLNGRKYREEITSEEEKKAKDNNLVVVFGASDDLCEFRGAIDEELGAWDGNSFKVKKKKLSVKELGGRNVGWIENKVEGKNVINQIWAPQDEEQQTIASWKFQTEIEHETFKIYDDYELYCIGIVFSIDDLK